MLNLKVTGVREAIAALGHLSRQLEARLQQALRRAGAMVAGEARRIVYKGHAAGHLKGDTGRLRQSILYELHGSQAHVGTNVEYARIHELGGTTAPHLIVPRKAKALRFEIDGNVVFRASVKHPGSVIPARPYLQPALEAKTPEINAAFDRVIRELLP